MSETSHGTPVSSCTPTICRSSARIRACRCGARIRASSSTSPARVRQVPVLRHALPPRGRRESGSLSLRTDIEAGSAAPPRGTGERVLVIAPSWVGDAILSEPLIASLRSRGGRRGEHRRPRAAVVRAGVRADAGRRPDHRAPVGARRVRVARAPPARPGARVRRATRARTCCRTRGNRRSCRGSRAFRVRIGYRGEARLRIADRGASARPARACRSSSRATLRSRAAGPHPGGPTASAGAGPRSRQPRRGAASARTRSRERRSRSSVPAPSTGPAKRWPAEHFADARAATSPRTAMRSGSSARPTTRRRQQRSSRRCGDQRVAGARSHRTHRPRHGDRPAVGRVDRRQQRFRADARRCGRAARRSSRCSDRRRRSTRRRCPPTRGSRASTSRAAPASSANARSDTFSCMRDLAPELVYNLARATSASDPAPHPPSR